MTTATYNISEISKISPSPYGGNGLFATKDLLVGTILLDSEPSLTSHMNDADMKYPDKWDYDSLYNTLQRHQKSNNVNTIYYHPRLIVTKTIKKGTEMEKMI